jgi:hypothetical protein
VRHFSRQNEKGLRPVSEKSEFLSDCWTRKEFYETQIGCCLKTGDRIDARGEGPPFIDLPGVGKVIRKSVAEEWKRSFEVPQPRAKRKKAEAVS